MLPLAKKRKTTDSDDENDKDAPKKNRATLASLSRSVTPPLTSRDRLRNNDRHDNQTDHTDRTSHSIDSIKCRKPHDELKINNAEEQPRIIRSPIQLTHIRDLPADKNIDTIQLHDILGDPMIRECWQFNYCFDIDFLMDQFDQDVKDLVQVKIVHGSWKQDSANRIRIDVQSTPPLMGVSGTNCFQEACARYPNVEPIVAYMPEPFGTHHSKMMVLLRHDDLAQ
ncbi:uncharacterized protein BHQ10_006141 [Talaromyces amestolkiae]|uniref:Uncharacterized protein n=1 Tax=Talaromyces amestolkiae TaxID=1196081 RepID=A0A364L2U2_TALAM|nr:uncharacterized protein BHQ10_006141 [Talaromyces amestolkiae]RAO70129.1 hypothetical protein BHQ10_006141 [Talaromyces amestolkiae]